MQHAGKGVNDLCPIAPIADTARQDLGETQAALRLAQQNQAAIGGDQAAIEGGAHLLAAHGWQIEGERGIVGHGGCSPFVAWEERRFDNEFLPDGNELHHARQPKIRPAVNNPG